VLLQDGQVILDYELVGLPKSWEPFVQGICARDMLPGFESIWNDCIQEETWLMFKDDMDGLVLFVPRQSSFISMVVLRVRE
jgi:hypothetical protein